MLQAKTLLDCLKNHAQQRPEHCAISSSGVAISYADLAHLVAAQANKFTALGVSESSTVGICCADDAKHLVMSLAAMKLGATSCTIPSYESSIQQVTAAERCGATLLLDETTAVDLLESDASKPALNIQPSVDAQLLFSTSGTTGEPKRVIHRSSDLVYQAPRHISGSDERFACLAGIEHNFAKRHRLYCVAMGATNVFLDPQPSLLVEQCRALEVNTLHVSAFQAQELLAVADIASLKGLRLKLGGSHIPLTLRQQLREKITPTLCAGYGTTETGAISFTDPDDLESGESVGTPLAGIEVTVRKSDKSLVERGQRGEIAIRCDGMFRGYQGLDEKTAERLVDGWFFTGDVGYLDQRGRIHLSGRADDMFVFNSINIFPQEIEASLTQHPEVLDAAVLAKESGVHGCIPVALVVFANGDDSKLSELRKCAREQIGIRCPRQFLAVREIPRNSAGKILRNQARELINSAADIRSTIVNALKDAGAVSQIAPSNLAAFKRGDLDISLDDLELDSMARMELLIALETEHELVITPQEFSLINSLEDIVVHHQSREVSESEEPETPQEDINQPIPDTALPSVVKLFQRVYRMCMAVAQLNKALETFEHRLSPLEIATLSDHFRRDRLIPPKAQSKYREAIESWLSKLERLMRHSGKSIPEAFVSKKVATAAILFTEEYPAADKTLLVCFSTMSSRRMMMPHSAFLQHLDAKLYDVLIVSDVWKNGFRGGVPRLGANVPEIVNWLSDRDWIRRYQKIQSFGCSAGSYPALLAGYRLNTERTVCIGGRFPAERHLAEICRILANICKAVWAGHCGKLILAYGADKSRDRIFARIVSWLTRGNRLAVEIPQQQVGHRVLEQLLEQGELGRFLNHSLLANKSEPLLTGIREIQTRRYPPS